MCDARPTTHLLTNRNFVFFSHSYYSSYSEATLFYFLCFLKVYFITNTKLSKISHLFTWLASSFLKFSIHINWINLIFKTSNKELKFKNLKTVTEFKLKKKKKKFLDRTKYKIKIALNKFISIYVLFLFLHSLNSFLKKYTNLNNVVDFNYCFQSNLCIYIEIHRS